MACNRCEHFIQERDEMHGRVKSLKRQLVNERAAIKYHQDDG